MKFIQNYHNEHTKFTFGMLIVVILYEFHTSQFAVYITFQHCMHRANIFKYFLQVAADNLCVHDSDHGSPIAVAGIFVNFVSAFWC